VTPDPDEPWRPDDPFDDGEGAERPPESSGSGRSDMPSFTVELPSGRLALRGVVRILTALAIFATGAALVALDHGARTAFELLALVACASGGLVIPTVAVSRRLARYPRTGTFSLSRRGFRLPWLGADAPGPEGPWEALRGFQVRKTKGTGRILVLEVAAGRFALTDRLLGEQAFDAALEVLERALGPSGVLLGTVVRLPIHPTDRRSLREKITPRLLALLVATAFGLLAFQATLAIVRGASIFLSLLAALSGSLALDWNRRPGAELVLALDGLVVPLPDDLRRTIKVPFSALRRHAVEDEGGKVALVIEHDDGRLLYPLEWFDAREAKEFARKLSSRSS